LNADPAIALLPDWPDTLYNLACDQSRAGRTEQAQATLQQAVDLGASISADQLEKDPDLSALHHRPGFEQLVDTLRRQEALWNDSAAIATPYKPILTEDEKVAGMSKFWSEARFNFPFFSRLSGLDWDALYMAYLAKVRDSKTTADYYCVMIGFAAELKDGHTNVYPPPQLFNTLYAAFGLRTSLVEGSVVVTEVLDANLRTDGWKVGDVILKVGDLNIREYAETKVAPYVSSSTGQDREVRAFNYSLFSGDVNDPLVLTAEDADGKRQVRTIKRLSTDVVGPMFKIVGSKFKLLPGNIAYVAVNEFEDESGVKTIPAHLSQVHAAKGLILDLRHNGGGNSQNGSASFRCLPLHRFSGKVSGPARAPKFRTEVGQLK
jgi:carboxyl-terminal processing protease